MFEGEDRIYRMEEEFHGRDKKQFKKEKKLAIQKDRSQYKKTDQDKISKRTVVEKPEGALEGKVIQVKPEGVVVCYENRDVFCSLKGVLKKQQTKVKNLVAVGDNVYFQEIRTGEGVILEIAPRFSILSRADNLSRNKEQLLAVNVDQVIITCSVMYPRLRAPLIDRYIIATLKGNMKPVIVVNKMDLLEEGSPAQIETFFAEEKALLEDFVTTYRSLGIPVILTSMEKKEGIDELKQVMQNKTSVFSGQSGVGKSSLINETTGADLRTRDIVGKTNKGAHTTTTATLIHLDCGGYCIDTPGIRSFGVWNLSKEDIKEHFSEFDPYVKECKFPDCCHMHEPVCGVKNAVEEGLISPLRFGSYLALMLEIEQEHRSR